MDGNERSELVACLLWFLLAVISLPLAVLALILFPLVWLIGLPLRLIGISVKGVLELLEAIVRLPARVLSGTSGRR